MRHSGNLLAGIHNPVWYELNGSMIPAIQREKRLQDGERKRKNRLTERIKFDWEGLENLYHAII